MRKMEQEDEGLPEMREVCSKVLKRHPKKRIGKIRFQEFTTVQRISLLALKVQKHQQGIGYFYYVWLEIATELMCMIYEDVNKPQTQYFVKQ